MDLFTLPDEMLASVCKYTSCEHSIKIRKTNNKINQIFMRYRIKTLDMEELSISINSDVDIGSGNEVNIELERKDGIYVIKKYTHQVEQDPDLQSLLHRLWKTIFEKVKSSNQLKIRVPPSTDESVCFDQDVINIIRASTIKQTKSFRTRGVHFKFGSKQQLKEFLHQFKFERLEIVCSSSNDIDCTLCDEVIDGLSFKVLIWPTLTAITIDGLTKLCASNLPEQLTLRSDHLTITDITQFFMTLDKNCLTNRKDIVWTFYGTVPTEMNEQQIEQSFKIFKLYRIVKVKKDAKSVMVSLQLFDQKNWYFYNIQFIYGDHLPVVRNRRRNSNGA